jgi:uncharacterized protein YxjI
MKNIKDYNQFVNEEINLKKALVGGAIAASSLLGSCEAPSDSGYSNTNNTEVSQDYEVSSELPNEVVMSQKFISIGTDMDILDKSDNTVGKVEERIFNFGRTFEYMDNSGNLVAKAKQRVLSLYTIIDITDANGTKIGSVEQEVLESLFSIYSTYSIKDASGRVLAKSKKLEFFTTDIEIEDKSGGSVSITKDYINMFGDTWRLNMNTEIDKRLIIFIPSFVSSTQQSRKEE